LNFYVKSRNIVTAKDCRHSKRAKSNNTGSQLTLPGDIFYRILQGDMM